MTINVFALKSGPHIADLVGFIPSFLSEDDPRPAKEQFDERYAHGGGWRPFPGFKLKDDGSIKYPGDPAHQPVAAIRFRQELVLIYEYGWVLIQQKDGSFEISRMD